MSGYYAPNPHMPPQYYVNPNLAQNQNILHGPSIMAPDGSVSHSMAVPFVPYAEPQMQQTYMDQYDEIPGGIGLAQGGTARMRRRTAPGDSVKHRRTRSGCFTCRQRRVKCDESHPICERCRKGNRECAYPEPQSTAKARSGSKSGKSATVDSSPEDQDEEESKDRLDPILDDDEEEDLEDDCNLSSKSHDLREPSDTPSLTLDRSPTPPTETSSTTTNVVLPPPLSRKSSSQATRLAPLSSKTASGLPPDVRFYLEYFRDHVSHHHYALKTDTSNFLKTDFLDMAIQHEPLRYAVVGYAAYYHTLSKPDGRISTFLQYYNESVSRLRAAITKHKKQSLATFLTILQLASIEEALGDWVNLMGHQKAAYEILTRLYTPQTITQTELLRKTLLWYIRFDLFVGFQSGGESGLGREWYVAMHDYYRQQAREEPDSINLKYEERFAYSRLVAKDSSDLFARKAKGLLSDEAFMAQLPILDEQVNSLEKGMDPMLVSPSGHVTEIPGKPDPEDIVNPYEPNVIWGGPQWTSNFLLLDTWGIVFMYNIQVSMAMRKPVDPALLQKAYRAVQLFEAVCAYPDRAPGAIIEAQATLAIATLFLPKDAKTIQWCRRTFAKIESAGYIYSSFLRTRMLGEMGVEQSDWWLPNDEACPPIIRSIKNFITERATAPKDQASEDLREMKGLFSTLTFSDSPSSDTTNNTHIEGALSLGVGGVRTHIDETLIYTGGSPDFDWSYKHKLPDADTYRSGQFSGQ